jgi:drug/metabolite transporter (DMT)-like permease
MATQSRTRIHKRITARRYDWLIALVLGVIGVLGLNDIVHTIFPLAGALVGDPADGPNIARQFLLSPNTNAVALVLLTLCITVLGAAWFVVRLLHWRFRPVFEPLKVWRQAVWVAVFVTLGAWLQLNRSLTIPLALLMLAMLTALEVFLNVRER